MKVWDIFRKCCSPIPQRFIVATMVMSAVAIQYIHRLAFNLAITEIVFKQNVTRETNETGEYCHYNDSSSKQLAKQENAEFHWSSQEQATAVGAFYIGYLITHIPAGVLADKYGPKRVMGFGVLLAAICTLLTPWSARVHVYMTTAIRITMGLAQGPTFPTLSVFIAKWSLPKDRNIMSSYTSAGVVVGAVAANGGTGFLLSKLKSWDNIFYIYGIGTLVWFIAWTLFAHDNPSQHPFINENERQKIHESLKTEINEQDVKLKLPLLAILKSPPVWSMILANCGHDWAFYIIVSLLPQYMSDVLHFSVRDNGLINCLPYITMVIISLLTAKLAEIVVSKGWMSKTFQCKLWLFIGNQMPCVLFIAASYSGCNRVFVVILFTLSMGFMGLVYSSVRVVNVDMAPNFAGTLMALMNGFGSLCGFLGPKVFALFTGKESLSSWRTAFFLSMIIVTITSVVFLIWGSSKLQKWNFQPDFQPNDMNEGSTLGNQSDSNVKMVK